MALNLRKIHIRSTLLAFGVFLGVIGYIYIQENDISTFGVQDVNCWKNNIDCCAITNQFACNSNATSCAWDTFTQSCTAVIDDAGNPNEGGGAECGECQKEQCTYDPGGGAGGGCFCLPDLTLPGCDISLPDPTCSDGLQNQGETDIDCGGPCDACVILGSGSCCPIAGYTGGSCNNLSPSECDNLSSSCVYIDSSQLINGVCLSTECFDFDNDGVCSEDDCDDTDASLSQETTITCNDSDGCGTMPLSGCGFTQDDCPEITPCEGDMECEGDSCVVKTPTQISCSTCSGLISGASWDTAQAVSCGECAQSCQYEGDIHDECCTQGQVYENGACTTPTADPCADVVNPCTAGTAPLCSTDATAIIACVQDSNGCRGETRTLCTGDTVCDNASCVPDEDEACLDFDQDGQCSVAEGGNDCDDTNMSIYPGADDVCGDGIDQDCSGTDQICSCDVTSRTPDTSTICVGTMFTQTSNCNTTRQVAGTQICAGGGCVDNTRTPSPVAICAGESFTQTSNCGMTRSNVGTKNCSSVCTNTSWLPGPTQICAGESFTQTSNCGETRGATGTKSCSLDPTYTYSWQEGPRGACSKTCGGGTQSRTLSCVRNDGTTSAQSFCPASDQPITSKDCNMQSCGICTDNETRPCGDTDTGVCTLGIQTCVDGQRDETCVGVVGPVEETCDEQDNDCDGVVDEEVKNLCGTCGDTPNEICDDIDNDCDGEIDEGDVCGDDYEPECMDGDKKMCGGGGHWVFEHQGGGPTGPRCHTTKYKVCVEGEWSECGYEKEKICDEICDGKDNDDDGLVDEGDVCDMCRSGDTISCGSDVGVCESGVRVCDQNSRGVCRNSVGPTGEICDGKDNDCDGLVDEGDVCMTKGGGGSGTRRGGSNYCGDDRLRLDLGEECDDGNFRNGDGCSSNCKREESYERGDDNRIGPTPRKPIVGPDPIKTPSQDLEERLGAAMRRMRLSCSYDDVNYDDIYFQDVQWEEFDDPADVLKTYCIVKGYDKTHRAEYHTQAYTSIAEFIKMVAKIDGLYQGVIFNEYESYKGKKYFVDVSGDAWYASYVGYAYEHGLLEYLDEYEYLKPNTPISYSQAQIILYNAGIKNDYRSWMGSTGYLRRDVAAYILVDAFADVFVDYQYMYGHNVQVYQNLLDDLRGHTRDEQVKIIKNMIHVLGQQNKNKAGNELMIHIDGIVDLLQRLLDGTIQQIIVRPGVGIGENTDRLDPRKVEAGTIDTERELRRFLGL